MDRIVRPPVRTEVEEELAFHVEMRVRELVARGWDEGEARAEALRRFGDIERVKADCLDLGEGRDGRMNRRLWLDEVRQDLTFALRQMRRAPGFAALAVATLALAIGANTAVFSVVNAVVVRPLPFPDPDRLSVVWTRYLPESGFDIDKFSVSGPEFLDYQESTRAFQSLGSFVGGSRALTGDGAEAERVPVGFFSHEVFPLLGVAPLHGRWFTVEEDLPDAAPVTVLGHDVWRTRYGADPAIVRRTILMNGTPTEVVGIMPPGFDFPGARAWLPLGRDRTNESGRASHRLSAIGRRRPGATQADADAELAVLRQLWAQEYDHNRGHFLWSQGLKTEIVGDAPRILLLLAAAVALVLLVACANVANLLLARGERRRGEVAVRTALGAGRGRIVRQLVTESLLVAGVAAVVGLALARVGTGALIALDPGALPRLDEVGLDRTVLLFTVAATLLTVGLFGVVPAYLTGLGAAASSGARAVGSRRRSRLRRALVTGEVSLSLVVVVLAGLTGRTLEAMAGTDPGFDEENVLAFRIALPSANYPDAPETPAAFTRLRARLEAVPGVRGSSTASALPFSGGFARWDFELDDRPPRQQGDLAWNAIVTQVGGGYFEALGIPLLEGRGITAADGPGDALIGVVSETMARTYWPGESALGKRWGYEMTDSTGNTYVPWITVVGVAPDQYVRRVDEERVPQVYLPQAQAGISGYFWPRSMEVVLRTGLEPTSLAPAVRAAVTGFDADLALQNVRTLEESVAASVATPRLTATLLGSFASIALLLATVGIYGVISYSVAGRTREIGVRQALGASRREVTRLIVGEGARPLLVGLGAGLLAAWLASRLVESLLYGVAPTDLLTFTALPAGLLAVGTLASLIPAWRATRVAPTEALREE